MNLLLFCFVFREYDSWDLMIDVNVKGHLHLMGKYKGTPSPHWVNIRGHLHLMSKYKGTPSPYG